jgi:hypothetical protein
MLRRRTGLTRAIATLIAALALVAALPRAALADDDGGIWGEWFREVANRGTKAEIPFAILFSFPAMVVVTPIWLAQVAMDKLRGDEEEEY